MTTDAYADALAEHLAAIAAELAVRVRDEDPATNAVWLRHRLPDPHDWFRLAFVMAAAIPDDKPWSELVAWIDGPAKKRKDTALPPRQRNRPQRPQRSAAQEADLKPCGTRAAARRHKYRKEPLDIACLEARRAWDRSRARARKEAA